MESISLGLDRPVRRELRGHGLFFFSLFEVSDQMFYAYLVLDGTNVRVLHTVEVKQAVYHNSLRITVYL